MTPNNRTLLMLTFAMLLAGAFGAWLGVAYGVQLAHNRPDTHELIHHALDLTADQSRRLATLETQFTARRSAWRHDMDVADHDLANALTTDHAFSVRARAASARYFQAEEQLREATILHALAMRAVLTPDQQQKLDFALVHPLPAEYRE